MNHEAPTLFDLCPSFNTHPRAEQIARAEGKVSPEFFERYEQILMAVGQVMRGGFIACDVTEMFERRYRPLTKVEQKGLGGFYQRLLRAGVLEKTGGYRARNQGNPSSVYRLKV